jgi:hypothetical protein
MSSQAHITRYSVMPLAPVQEQTEFFDAGPIRIGVEYRLLNDAIAAAQELIAARGDDPGQRTELDDCGVSLHVYGVRDGEALEHLRFDCFEEDPHYHYVSWDARSNEMLHIDPIADGDPVAWALERLRTRLPQMLARAGAQDVAAQLDPEALERVLPRVTEAAYRARYQHDADAILASATKGGRRG